MLDSCFLASFTSIFAFLGIKETRFYTEELPSFLQFLADFLTAKGPVFPFTA